MATDWVGRIWVARSAARPIDMNAWLPHEVEHFALALLREFAEQAAGTARSVLDWCKPIGQHDHMKWYGDAGQEIADKILAMAPAKKEDKP